MNLRYLLTLFFLLPTAYLVAQFNETIRSDRPGQSITPFAVGKNILQIQSGVDYFNNEYAGSKGSGGLSNTVFRYGITETFEISTMIEYKGETMAGSSGTVRGLSAVDFGLRYNIYVGSGLIPTVGFQTTFRLPNLGGDYEIDQWAPRFMLVTNQQLADKIFFTTNWGASWSGNDAIPQGNFTANVSYSLSDKIGLFVETYGNLRQSDFNIFWDTGIAYLLSNNLQLDLYTGFANNDQSKDFFISGGFSWRTKRKN